MSDAATLVRLYTTSYYAIKRQVDGLTHADSLVQFPFGGNCLNWTLGHITVSRLNLIAMLGDREGAALWTFSEARRYIPGSSPVMGEADDVTRFERIIDALDQSQPRFMAAIEATGTEKLAAKYNDGTQTLGEILAYYAAHEAYHAGQTELCRLLVGKPPAPGFE